MENSDKKYILFAGANGTGKSTLYEILPDKPNVPRVNIDEIARKYGSWRDMKVMLKAGREAVRYIRQYMDDGISFNQETTLCGKSILKNIRTAKLKGYYIEMHYVGVDSVSVCKERIAHRVSMGGHGIPDADVERRYTESLRNVRSILPEIDSITFYDNTVSFQSIAASKDGIIETLTENLPKWFKFVCK